ncbi:uncharacterized protein BXZ73DRAFT_88059 [Epithele typhae]|uniref:uncharacterized protein n=1 Tax=Epithele typhae TaxID=378194 RepID=UPI0020078AAF|nr:uncharacterized protein BXZ73DRAFT_88059 [Epithele typhae]KAH9942511.1 hypothetical protein BXZ73DRAFT_88059 [Epithele typhae]
MPPKPPNKPKPPLSKSRELVPIGPREVFKSRQGRQRDANGNKPLTARALVLRNGKHGAMGTGEMMIASRMSGREKLDLLAEDLMRKAIAAPFKLEVCLRIADGQLGSYLDEINALQDVDFLHDRFKSIVASHMNPLRVADLKGPNRARDHAVSTISGYIHNTYMMAAGWRLVGDLIRDLIDGGLDDAVIKAQLKAEPALRSQFLVLYDTVYTLVEAGQANFAILASSSRHYGPYFKKIVDPETKEPEYMFDWGQLKTVHKSFLDSIVVELCLPNSPIPRPVLYQLLSETVEESPKETKQFSQAVWDAVGDLSAMVELQSMLENVLWGSEGDEWRKERREPPEAYEQWVDAQIYSQAAANQWANFADIIYPMDNTLHKPTVEMMWKKIRENYVNTTRKSPDDLWGIADIRKVKASWHGFGRPKNESRALALSDNLSGLAITNGDESDGSMPPLQTPSDSDDGDDDDDESYDTDEEDELRDLLREAMDTTVASSDFYNPHGPAPEFDSLAQDRKDNPFLKLLGALRGRVFSANTSINTANRTQPRTPFPNTHRSPPRRSPPGSRLETYACREAAGPQRPLQTTLEEVEDEDVPSAAGKKKKKKKPKKKKASTAAAESEVIEPADPSPPPARAPEPVVHGTLPLASEQTAKSARTYIKEEGLAGGKQKVKTRGQADLDAIPEKKRKGFFSVFSRKSKDRQDDDSESEDEEKEKAKPSNWGFENLSRRTTGLMHQLLRTGYDKTQGLSDMRWERFVKLMEDMGFTYEPGLAGSPHPDPTIHPVALKRYAKKLKDTYGWNEEQFLQATSSTSTSS